VATTRSRKTSRKPGRKSTRRAARRRPAAAWFWALGLIAVAALVAVGMLVWSRSDSGQAALLNLGAENLYGEVQGRIDATLAEALPRYETDGAGDDQHDWLLPAAGPAAAVRCRVVPVDGVTPWWQVQEQLARMVAAAGGRVLWVERLTRGPRGRGSATPDETRDILRLDLGVAAHPTHTLLLFRTDAGRPPVRWGGDPTTSAWQRLVAGADGPVAAVVIDDWGYRRDGTTDGLLALDVPLTVSVLPGLPYSRHFALQGTDLALPAVRASGGDEAARRRRAAGCPVTVGLGAATASLETRRREVFLHLPMQPQAYPDLDPGPRAIMVGMDRDRMAGLLQESLRALPNVRGVNNHMGSAATSDAATMTDFMAVMRDADLIFLDSLTTARSVAYETARAAGVPTVRNRVFLDHDHQDVSRARRKLQELGRAARSSGFAVAIGHPKPATLAALRAEIPRLVADGVVFVTVSELLALQEHRGAAGR
jgi:polysaccharide deacetylase 2 family uncharacterized protein YibQ